MGRLELPRVTPLEPKSSASTSFATFAMSRLMPGGGRIIRETKREEQVKKKGPGTETGPWIGGPSPARTGDLLIKSQLLYQLS